MTEAEIILDYLAGLTTVQGAGVGKPFRILEWEAEFVTGAFSEGVDVAGLSISRGNGKSNLIGGICAAYIDDERLRQPMAEITQVAAAFRQAKVMFNFTHAFLKLKYETGDLTKLRDSENQQIWRVSDTDNNASIHHVPSGCKVVARPGDPLKLHGIQPVLVAADEPSSWDKSKREKAYSALVTSLGKLDDSRIILLGTRPATPDHFFSKLLAGGADFVREYSAPKDSDISDPAIWLLANPSMPYFPALEKKIRKASIKAAQDASELSQFLALRCNAGVSDVRELHCLEPATYLKFVEVDTPPERLHRPCVAYDLSGGAAMVAAAAYFPESHLLEVIAAFPEGAGGLKSRGLADGVGSDYLRMYENRELILLGKHAVPMPEFIEIVLQKWGTPRAVAFDRFKANDMREWLDSAGVPLCDTYERGMGYLDGGADYRRFMAEVLAGRVKTGRNFLFRSGLAEARVIADASNNQKLCKASEGGRRMRGRDDVVAAAILAVSVGSRLPQIVNRPYRSARA